MHYKTFSSSGLFPLDVSRSFSCDNQKYIHRRPNDPLEAKSTGCSTFVLQQHTGKEILVVKLKFSKCSGEK